MQKKKQNDFAPQIDFKEQTPEMVYKGWIVKRIYPDWQDRTCRNLYLSHP